MNVTEKIDGIISELGCVMKMVNLMECDEAYVPNHAYGHIINIKAVLIGIKQEINTITATGVLAESQRDSLLLAIAGTNEGRFLDINTDTAISKAMTIVRVMDADIRTSREAEEIPFGAVEQDREKMELEKRVAELELQLELKVDECAANERHLLEIKSRCVSLIKQINNRAPGYVNPS